MVPLRWSSPSLRFLIFYKYSAPLELFLQKIYVSSIGATYLQEIEKRNKGSSRGAEYKSAKSPLKPNL